MAGSVIDSLVVTLGMDSKEFAKGIKGSTEELAGFTRRLAGMFLAVRGLEDVVGYFKDLHAQLAEIGFTARNLGVAGTEIKKLGEVSELFGGQVQDAADSIQNLQSSVFNLRYKGQLSENLLMLQRFGVAYLDAAGNARELKDVALDAAKVIDRRRAQGAKQGELTQLALSFGFTGGIASAVAQGSKGFDEAFKKAQVDQKSLTDRTIQGQVKLARDLTSASEHTAALNSTILSKMTPAIEAAVAGLRHLADDVLPKIVEMINALINFFKNPPAWITSLIDGLKQLSQFLGPGGSLIAALVALRLAIIGKNALLGGGAPGSGGFGSISGKIADKLGLVGTAILPGLLLGELIAKLPSGGALDKFNEWIADLFNTEAEQAGAAATARSPVHGTIARVPATPTAPRPPVSGQAAATAGPTSTNSTQIHIDEINVNTRASDADGIAGSIGGAMQRKLLVSNADQGQG